MAKKQTFKGSVPWFTNFQAWMFFAGIVIWAAAFVISHGNPDNDTLKTAKEILMSIGSAIIAGVLIGSIMSHRQLRSFYLNELGEVIFGEKFLSSRTDIEDVWDRATKAFFCSKFAEINKDLLDIVKNIYFSKEHVSYYQNYTHTITVDWHDPDKKYIKVADKCSFDLIADSERPIPFFQEHWLKVKEGDDEKNYSCQVSIKVDDNPEQIANGTIAEGCLHTKWETVLGGKNKYHIIKNIKRHYNFEADHFFGFRAKYITNGMHIAVVHPIDMGITCVERGTQNNFTQEIFTPQCCEFRYNGLILPRQGYVIIMSKL